MVVWWSAVTSSQHAALMSANKSGTAPWSGGWLALRASPFNIDIAGRAARTSTHDRHSRIRCLEAVLLCDRIEIGLGNVSTHVESPGLEGQDVLGALLGHGLGPLFLPPHRIDRHEGAVHISPLQQWGNGRNFLGLVLDFSLA